MSKGRVTIFGEKSSLFPTYRLVMSSFTFELMHEIEGSLRHRQLVTLGDAMMNIMKCNPAPRKDLYLGPNNRFALGDKLAEVVTNANCVQRQFDETSMRFVELFPEDGDEQMDITNVQLYSLYTGFAAAFCTQDGNEIRDFVVDLVSFIDEAFVTLLCAVLTLFSRKRTVVLNNGTLNAARNLQRNQVIGISDLTSEKVAVFEKFAVGTDLDVSTVPTATMERGSTLVFYVTQNDMITECISIMKLSSVTARGAIHAGEAITYACIQRQDEERLPTAAQGPVAPEPVSDEHVFHLIRRAEALAHRLAIIMKEGLPTELDREELFRRRNECLAELYSYEVLTHHGGDVAFTVESASEGLRLRQADLAAADFDIERSNNYDNVCFELSRVRDELRSL